MVSALYQQCLLSNGNTSLICWLESAKIKEGYRVTLDDSPDPQKWWTIKKITTQKFPRTEIKDSHASKKWYQNDFHGKLKGLHIT